MLALGMMAMMRPALLSLLVSLLIASGCQTTTTGYVPPTPPKTKVSNQSGPLQEQSVLGNISSDEAVMTDPSAARLHEIAGAMLYFRAIKGEMPKSLDELKSVSDEELNLVCPQSNMPYVYVPDGLHSPGKSKAVVVYEPTARPNGTRWCILMADAKPGGAQSLEVLEMTDAVFLGYR
jgi:hypothetical protein